MTTTTKPKKQLTELERLWQLAEESAKQRLDAPPTDTVPGMIRIAAKEKQHRVMKQYGGQDKKRHGLFIDAKKAKEYAYKGYRPELEDGELVRNDTDIFVSCDVKLYKEELRQNSVLSNIRRNAAMKKVQNDDGTPNEVSVENQSQVTTLVASE
jgi:hypothetical protein